MYEKNLIINVTDIAERVRAIDRTTIGEYIVDGQKMMKKEYVLQNHFIKRYMPSLETLIHDKDFNDFVFPVVKEIAKQLDKPLRINQMIRDEVSQRTYDWNLKSDGKEVYSCVEII